MSIWNCKAQHPRVNRCLDPRLRVLRIKVRSDRERLRFPAFESRISSNPCAASGHQHPENARNVHFRRLQPRSIFGKGLEPKFTNANRNQREWPQPQRQLPTHVFESNLLSKRTKTSSRQHHVKPQLDRSGIFNFAQVHPIGPFAKIWHQDESAVQQEGSNLWARNFATIAMANFGLVHTSEAWYGKWSDWQNQEEIKFKSIFHQKYANI